MSYWEYNPEHDGIEIYFDGIPDEEMRAEMKANGWRWHRIKKCWYNFSNEWNEEFADQICDDFDSEYEDDYEEKIIEHYVSKRNNENKNLIKCVDCGKMISTRASYCLNCGAPIDYIKETHRKREVEKQKKEKLAKEREAKRREDERRAREEEERKKALKEKEEKEQIRKYLEEVQKKREEEASKRVAARCSAIMAFRDEFGISKSMTDSEVEKCMDYLKENGRRIGTANYMLGDRVVVKVGKYGERIGLKLYKSAYDIIMYYL